MSEPEETTDADESDERSILETIVESLYDVSEEEDDDLADAVGATEAPEDSSRG